MIIAEVYVYALDKTYDFKLNENVPMELLADEICEMACKKEQCRIDGNTEELMFCRIKSGQLLPMDRTLSEMNIHTGEKLALI